MLINKAWTLKLALLSALSVLLVPARSQVSNVSPGKTTATRMRNSDDQPRVERRRRIDSGNKRKETSATDAKDDSRRHKPDDFRKLMQAEMSHMPALDKRMDRLMRIQAERYDLQQKRQKVAVDETYDREGTVKRFHFLLRRDLQLSDEARAIGQEIVGDMSRIQKQLNQRRSELKTELEAQPTTGTATETSTTQAREFRRRIKYLDFLENKLGDLKEHPERLDLLARVLRGIPLDDAPPPAGREKRSAPRGSSDQSAQAQMENLQDRRKTLQRELRQVEKRIDELRDGSAGEKQQKPL